MKTFNEWLNEAKEVFNFNGWNKITKVSFINDMKENKSLLLYAKIMTHKPKDYGVEFLKKYATPSELLALVNDKKKNNEWRTVYTVNSNSIKFKRPNGNISSMFFDEKGQRTFYKMKLGSGTCYLSYLFDEDEKNPYMDDEETTYSHGFIFYYIEN